MRSDRKVKHGEYLSYYIVNDGNSVSTYIKEKAYYKYGKKDSLWVEYYRPIKSQINRIKTKGSYNNGEKVGVWLKYKKEIIEKYDYDNSIELSPEVLVELNYPDKARESGVEGLVFISYKVNSDCSVYDIRIVRSLSDECDKEVRRVIEKQSELKMKYGIKCRESEIVRKFRFRIAE